MVSQSDIDKIIKFRQEIEQYGSLVHEFTGFGSDNKAYQNMFSGHDRLSNASFLAPNKEQSGLVFFSRPRLNLTSTNLSFNRILAPLNVLDPLSVAFGIRCALDTRFMLKHRSLANQCPFVNPWSPFFILLGNTVQTLTGWPSWQLESTTTEGGYHNENQTFPIGHDKFYNTYNLNATFKDVQFSPVRNTFLFWLEWMAGAVCGDLIAYPDAIDMFRMDFTVAIYRFVFNETGQYITIWSKGTGCYPTSLDLGKFVDFDRANPIVDSGTIETTFTVNNVKYQDFARIIDFNMLVRRYCPNIDELPELGVGRETNYRGVPYIKASAHGFQMVWKDPSGLPVHNIDYEQQKDNPATIYGRFKQVLANLDDEIRGVIYKSSSFKDNLIGWLDKTKASL
jgi:hypothetical protein